jgi:glycine betaine/choline ABC-type transport system substrate-binding protein
VIFAGAIPVAVLALVVDGALFLLERALSSRRRRSVRVPLLVALAVGGGALAVVYATGSRGERLVVGSKNFTEQVVLGELVAQAMERYAGIAVDRRLNLGGTFICDRALQAGDIDIYVEYSGTALTAVFKQPVERNSAAVLDHVRSLYADTGRTILRPLGFNNTFAILVRSGDARALGLTRISQLSAVAGDWRAGFGYEFLERADGYPGLASTYGLSFTTPPRVMDLTLIYRALAQKQVDVIAGDATAGLIDALDLTALEDDRHYFPPYDAVPVVRSAALLRHPEMRRAVERLAGRVTAAEMRRMNRAVDADRQDPAVVVRAFLDRLDRGV